MLDPVSHSLGLTAIFAVSPLVVLFLLLGGFRMKARLQRRVRAADRRARAAPVGASLVHGPIASNGRLEVSQTGPAVLWDA